jgi:hypothetical protein
VTDQSPANDPVGRLPLAKSGVRVETNLIRHSSAPWLAIAPLRQFQLQRYCNVWLRPAEDVAGDAER